MLKTLNVWAMPLKFICLDALTDGIFFANANRYFKTGHCTNAGRA